MRFVLLALGGVLAGIVIERVIPPPRSHHRNPAEHGGRPVGRGSGKRRWTWRRVIGVGSLVLFVTLLLGTVGGYLWARSIFDRIERVEVSAALGHGSSGTNYLLVGADNGLDGEVRDGLDQARSDTIMILNIDGSNARMMSLNRDLWVLNPATGQHGRLNATYRQGPLNLIEAIEGAFGIPIDRYVEVDFFAFGGLVDALGGIDIEFAHPAFDLASGLNVTESGLVHLDGDQALAYVRSRHYTEVIDGVPVEEPGLPDVNRVQRQQRFLRATMAKAGASRNPVKLMRVADSVAGGLRIDDAMSMGDAARFAWRMGRLDPEPVILPVMGRTTDSGDKVLELGPGAEDVLATFR